IVSQEMFYSCADPLTLHSLDVAHGDARRQEGVFAKVFEIPAVHRSTIDIHSRPKKKMHTLGARIPSDLSAHLLRQGWIPCCGQSYSTGHRCRWPIVTHSQRSIRHLETRDTQPGNAAHIEIVHPAQQVNLLLDCHLAQDGIDSALN